MLNDKSLSCCFSTFTRTGRWEAMWGIEANKIKQTLHCSSRWRSVFPGLFWMRHTLSQLLICLAQGARHGHVFTVLLDYIWHLTVWTEAEPTACREGHTKCLLIFWSTILIMRLCTYSIDLLKPRPFPALRLLSFVLQFVFPHRS